MRILASVEKPPACTSSMEQTLQAVRSARWSCPVVVSAAISSACILLSASASPFCCGCCCLNNRSLPARKNLCDEDEKDKTFNCHIENFWATLKGTQQQEANKQLHFGNETNRDDGLRPLQNS